MGRAQVARHDVHHADLSAMGIQKHQFLDAGTRHASAQFHPDRHQCLRRQGQRAGEANVFRAQADLLGGHEQHRQVGWQVGQASLNHPVDEGGVHTHRQVRAVLFGRGDGEHGNGLFKLGASGEL